MIGLAVVVGAVVGLSLGLLGGGGSILTVPALVYLLGQDVSSAASTSLIVVGTNALMGAGAHSQAGRVRWKAALVFGAAGLVGALPGVKLNHLLPGAVVLLLFAFVMLAAAVMMVRRRPSAGGSGDVDCSGVAQCLRAGGVGAGVGFMTGFFGVGGGFLIVPALAAVLGLAMPLAVGTSLAVISLNSASGLFGNLLFGHVELGLAIPLILGGALGILVGSRLAGRLPERTLRQLFALLLVVLAGFLAYQNGLTLWHAWLTRAA